MKKDSNLQEYFVYIPTSITANGDSNHEVFKVYTSVIDSTAFYLKVLKENKVLFETDKISKGWNAYANNADAGRYKYELQIAERGGEYYLYEGGFYVITFNNVSKIENCHLCSFPKDFSDDTLNTHEIDEFLECN